jgi:hypothetical protein
MQEPREELELILEAYEVFKKMERHSVYAAMEYIRSRLEREAKDEEYKMYLEKQNIARPQPY